jgi:hypothetical protein
MAKHRSHIVRPVTAKREMFTNRSYTFVFSDKIEDWITSNSTTGYTKRVKERRRMKKEQGIVNH